MAATRPIAVANSASAMPGATTARLVFLLAAMPEKECMMPQTVPNRPMNGAVEPTEARKTIQRSIRSISRPTVTVMARSTRSRTPPRAMSAPATRAERRHSPMAAPNTAATGCAGLAPSWSYSSSRLPPDQNRSSNASAWRLARRSEVTFSKMIAQTQMLASSSSTMTILTTMSACRNSVRIDRSPPGTAAAFAHQPSIHA